VELALLRTRPTPVPPDQGDRAFAEHKLLSSMVHRATLLSKPGPAGEGRGWIQYLTAHFPEGHNGANDAELLWKEWRTPLLKKDCPGPMVPITHGKPELHWKRDQDGRLCIDLESMWNDFAYSVDHLVKHLRATPERGEVVLQRLQASQWSVQFFDSTLNTPVSGATAMARPTASATVGAISPTAITP
jgi:hypothetical protein